MTKQESIKYAQACRMAKKNGLEKPERPDGVNTSLLEMHRLLTKTQTSMELLNAQMMVVLDYLCELSQRSPQAEAYKEVLDFVCGSYMHLETDLKKIR